MATKRSFKRNLASEARVWVEQEVISEKQAEDICGLYDIDYRNAATRTLGYNTLVILGVLFLALSLITLIGANWNSIPRVLRMSALIALTLSVHSVGAFYFLQGKTKVAINLFFLGNFCYGASSILIAQIYHLGEHMPDGIFIWALGCLPLSVLCKSELLSLQTLGLAMIWFYTESSLGYYPALFPLFFVPSIWILWQSDYNKALFSMVVVSVLGWFQYSLAKFWDDGAYFQFEAEHIVVSVSLVCLTYFLGVFLLKKKPQVAQDYGYLLSDWSLRVALVAGVVFSYEEVWAELSSVVWDHSISMLTICLLFSAAAGWLAWQSNEQKRFIYSQTLFYIVGAFTIVFGAYSPAIYYQIVFNLLLLGVGILMISTGIQSNSSRDFFSGITLLLILAFLRYIDLVGNYVGGAILFLLFAMVMLGAAWSWKRIQSRADIEGKVQ